ncbi:MAG: divergent polysaccharide deacetylase family protein, partial [Gemmatimonadetes bacterium]|nr:divergent polysaccharide deacetylase family protein [Gemmatimonadota bacterium]
MARHAVHPTPARAAWIARAILLASASALLFLLVHRAMNPAAADAFASWQVDEAMDDVFRREALDRRQMSGRPSRGDEPLMVSAVVPPEASLTHVNVQVARAVERAGGQVFEALESGRDPELPERVELAVGRADQVTHRVSLRQAFAPANVDLKSTPRIAVVFDDLGYRMDGLAADLLGLPIKLTFAVLPGLAHSQNYAAAAARRGHDVILHLPMEPLNRHRHDPGPDALLVDLAPEENLRRLRRSLDGFGGYLGVSNHMGSRFTAESDLMGMVLAEIRKRDRGLFFLDSSTTPYSAVGEAARRAGVSYLENNLFLDGEGVSADEMAARVAGIARREGYAVAIGHVRRETVETVRRSIELWEAQGIR